MEPQIFDKFFEIRGAFSLFAFFFDTKGYPGAIVHPEIEKRALDGMADLAEQDRIVLGQGCLELLHMCCQCCQKTRQHHIDLFSGQAEMFGKMRLDLLNTRLLHDTCIHDLTVYPPVLLSATTLELYTYNNPNRSFKSKTVPTHQKDSSTPPLPAIVARVAAFIRRHHLVNRNDKVVVAVSGGADSLALLHILRALDLPLQLLAVYIDHGLRPLETPEEQTTVAGCCQALAVPYLTRSVDVRGLAARDGRGLEEAARNLRYQALEEVRREHGAQVIAVGHTADDQTEEFFIRLIRGSGRKGLSGMMLRRDRIIRPLLREPKAALVDYLQAANIRWCRDSSNFNLHFLRNRVRLQLLPLLQSDFNPAIRRTVLQTMDVLGEEEDFLEAQTAEAFARCVTAGVEIVEGEERPRLVVDDEHFHACHPAIRRRVLEGCFWRMAIPPTYRQIQTLLGFFGREDKSGEIHLEDGVRAERRGVHLVLCRPLAGGQKRGGKKPPLPINLTIAGPGCYFIPEAGRELVLEERPGTEGRGGGDGRLYLDRARITFPLLLRPARPGELFHPCNGPGRRKVSRYLNDRKIPAKERMNWPVLVSENGVIALPGLQIDQAYRVTETTTTLLVIAWSTVKAG